MSHCAPAARKPDCLKLMPETHVGDVLKDGNGSVGHGSWVKWVTIFGWVIWVTASDPLTHGNEITAQYFAFFVLS